MLLTSSLIYSRGKVVLRGSDILGSTGLAAAVICEYEESLIDFKFDPPILEPENRTILDLFRLRSGYSQSPRNLVQVPHFGIPRSHFSFRSRHDTQDICFCFFGALVPLDVEGPAGLASPALLPASPTELDVFATPYVSVASISKAKFGGNE
jgi:hypothetical protein